MSIFGGNMVEIGHNEEGGEKETFNVSELFSFDNFENEIQEIKNVGFCRELESQNLKANKLTFCHKNTNFCINHEEKNLHPMTLSHKQTILKLLSSNISLIDGVQGSGKTHMLRDLVKVLLQSPDKRRTLFVCDSESKLDALFGKLRNEHLMASEGHHVIRLGVKDVFIPVDKEVETKRYSQEEEKIQEEGVDVSEKSKCVVFFQIIYVRCVKLIFRKHKKERYHKHKHESI
jgi:hypothetical protein